MPHPEPNPFARIPLPASPFSGQPGHAQPLQGLTILVVEDSRLACEALRLFAQRAGARLRRAETLETARAHLRTYRPDVAIVDLGLPDGRGEALIRELALSRPRSAVIIGMSGLPEGRGPAMAEGADAFIDKPIGSYRDFCALLSAFLPDRQDMLRAEPGFALPAPDPLALHDDLERAAEALRQDPGSAGQRFVGSFLAGIARVAQDDVLAEAGAQAARGAPGLQRLRDLVDRRLAREGALIAPVR